jgi:hypothetical protein
VGTVSGSDAAMKLLDVARATLRTTFRPRFELRVPRSFFDLRLVAAKVAADYADLRRRKQDRTRNIADDFKASALHASPGNRSGCPTSTRQLCPPHVCASASVDLDRFAFLDEKRDIDGLAGFKLCGLGDVAGGIATNSFR